MVRVREKSYGENLKLLDKALQLLPEVKETVVEPLDIAAFLKPLKKGDSVKLILVDILWGT